MGGDSRAVNTVQDKSERRSELEDRLVDAAEAIVAITGLPGLRARDVAERAGCSVGAIYGVFPDLDTVILAVNGRTLAEIVSAMRSPAAGSPARQLEQMAAAYLDYAAQNRPRWAALFQHRMPAGRAITPGYAEQQAATFALIEAPLTLACPGLPDPAIVARSLFSAVHGIVELGLDERIAPMSMLVLHQQIHVIMGAAVRGLTLDPGSPGLTQGSD